MTISENYKKLSGNQVDIIADVFKDAWKNPEIPARQYEAVVKRELEEYRDGQENVAFDALRKLLFQIPEMSTHETTLLDVGASSGYYSEVLRIIGFDCKYTAIDFSTYFKDLAGQLFPEMEFKVGSATALPFEDKSFDIILHGAVLMHLRDWEKAIEEAARVSKFYVIFHRTPVYTDDTPTEAFVKTAYGVPCLELHFNERDILEAFARQGLNVFASTPVFTTGNFGHVSYLLGATEVEGRRRWERA